ncbi:MAG: hypothetical protein A3E82_04270 [Gammaproteobacteria bacterium RIFCSPHIGHO2_12_FULL_38_11]|nr:MAG: hypothetical protein A3E82_04270 [Gammaproteobacteria bacterium RIFCSPHIGHO2_12_FULL_38_11]
MHQEVMSTTPETVQRYLLGQINWDAQAICLVGGRGVGKTTLMCQHFLQYYKDVSEALYFSADNVYVTATGLFAIAEEYFKYGGKALFIDEVHKYPNWETEIKNIIDTYRKKQLVFSGSSSVNLHQSKADLSRRVIYCELKGLSFREYLFFNNILSVPVTTLADILKNHMALANQFKGIPILKYFKDYLAHGYFPFFLEGEQDYHSRLSNVIEKVIFEDIAVIYNLKQSTLPVLKKILWLAASTAGLIPNIDNISRNIGVSREIIYNCLDYLDRSGLINNLYADATGMKLIRKPGKIFLENTNLLYAINGTLKQEGEIGNVRETFFVNQCLSGYRVNLYDQGDFMLDGKYTFEVGGKNKDFKQIKSIAESYLALDNIEIGFGRKIPLYLFGLLY